MVAVAVGSVEVVVLLRSVLGQGDVEVDGGGEARDELDSPAERVLGLLCLLPGRRRVALVIIFANFHFLLSLR